LRNSISFIRALWPKFLFLAFAAGGYLRRIEGIAGTSAQKSPEYFQLFHHEPLASISSGHGQTDLSGCWRQLAPSSNHR
jgi:hypothetical protein